MPPDPSATDAPGKDVLALRVNGEERRLPGPCTVEDLLRALVQDRRRIAVAVNREVVPRSGYAHRVLASGDRIEILEAVGGG